MNWLLVSLKRAQKYIERFFILFSAVTGCISISAFASLLDIPIGIRSYAIVLKICAITAGMKKYKSIIKKKKKKYNKIVLLVKTLKVKYHTSIFF